MLLKWLREYSKIDLLASLEDVKTVYLVHATTLTLQQPQPERSPEPAVLKSRVHPKGNARTAPRTRRPIHPR